MQENGFDSANDLAAPTNAWPAQWPFSSWPASTGRYSASRIYSASSHQTTALTFMAVCASKAKDLDPPNLRQTTSLRQVPRSSASSKRFPRFSAGQKPANESASPEKPLSCEQASLTSTPAMPPKRPTHWRLKVLLATLSIRFGKLNQKSSPAHDSQFSKDLQRRPQASKQRRQPRGSLRGSAPHINRPTRLRLEVLFATLSVSFDELKI